LSDRRKLPDTQEFTDGNNQMYKRIKTGLLRILKLNTWLAIAGLIENGPFMYRVDFK